MKVLSLCDGMSCGYMALKKAGIPIESYFASEIKPEAIKASAHNFPDIVHIGDVKKITYSDGVLHTENGDYKTDFDLVIFGSPCQSFSRAMKTDKRIGLADPVRSGIFYDCKRVLDEVKPKWFLVENVRMKIEDQNILSEMLGVTPIRINSKLVSAQNRDRLYWTNIENIKLPQDKGIALKDIIKTGYTEREKSCCLRANDSHGYYNGAGSIKSKVFHRAYNKKFDTIIYEDEQHFNRCKEYSLHILDGRKPREGMYGNAEPHIEAEFNKIRFLTKEERAKLQTVPVEYVECMTEKEAANLLGDGWTVDIIAHIFKELKKC